MDADNLFDAYSYYRGFTAHYQKRYKRALKRSPDRLKRLEEMSTWCKSRGLDPQYWLYSLFAARNWFYAPRWDQLCSAKNIANYERWKPHDGDRVRVQFTVQREERQWNWWRDVGGTSEALKQKYAARGDYQRCYYATDQTYGYHPRSPVCTSCPLSKPCLQNLQGQVRFDIVALRRGDITLEQARAAQANA